MMLMKIYNTCFCTLFISAFFYSSVNMTSCVMCHVSNRPMACSPFSFFTVLWTHLTVVVLWASETVKLKSEKRRAHIFLMWVILNGISMHVIRNKGKLNLMSNSVYVIKKNERKKEKKGLVFQWQWMVNTQPRRKQNTKKETWNKGKLEKTR